MTLSWNFIAHAIGIIAQAANALGVILPEEHKVGVAISVGILQGIVSLIAHYSNPDGTAAVEPYQTGGR
jgi:hypothetical protein